MTATLIECIFQILILTPLLFWGSKKNKSTDLKPVLFFAIINVLTQLLLQLDFTFFQVRQLLIYKLKQYFIRQHFQDCKKKFCLEGFSWDF
jgi:hypothetical protein